MKHVAPKALLGSAAVIIRKEGEDADPASIVTKALADFGTEFERKFGDRLKAIETKAGATDPDLIKRIDKIEAKANRHGGDKERDEQAEIQRKAFQAYLQRGRDADVDLKTLIVSSDPQGGYLAPPEFSTEFIRDLILFSPIRGVASVRTTGSPSVIYPTRTGVGSNAKWVGEVEARPKSEPTFGQLEVPIKELATYVDISNQLLADSGGTAEAEVRNALAEDFAQKEGLAFVNGDGVKQPMGIMTDPSIPYFANGSTTVLSTDALIGLMYSLPAQYRNRGSWLLNGNTLAAIRKLKDGQGNYLWQPSFQAGQPETVLGRPVVDVVDMDDPNANKFPIAYGDFGSGYRIIDRQEMSILVNPYILATNGITRIHATRRVGAGVLRPLAFKKLKMSVS